MVFQLVLTINRTGMKCLPQNKVAQSGGIVLHDWHAEILAIRSLNRFLLLECLALAQSPEYTSPYIRRRTSHEITEKYFQPFTLKDDVEFHMYCSEAPCGDASMELTQASQADGEPWVVPMKDDSDSQEQVKELQGRSYFSELGIVRRKPSRPDAPPTLSKSCSDKLALKQCISLLSSPASLLISPSNIYLTTLVMPESQYSESGCQRAFSADGRMKEVDATSWKGGYQFKPFRVQTTRREFRYCRRQETFEGEKLSPSNISAGWMKDLDDQSGSLEMIIAGVKQGRKQLDIKGASRVSKASIWGLAEEIATLVGEPNVQRCLGQSTYKQVKDSGCLNDRREVKKEVWHTALRGWLRNDGGEHFSIGDKQDVG